jgi:hypothetical protein
VLWQPAKVWTSRERSDEAESAPVPANAVPEPPRFRALAAQSEDRAPNHPEVPTTNFTPATGQAQNSNLEEPPKDRTSRLSGLRNLLFVLGVKNAHNAEEQGDEYAANGSTLPSRTGRQGFERSAPEAQEYAARNMSGASPRLVTAPPEFLPPRPVVIEFSKADTHVGESSTRQDRRAAADGVEILPSKRGQYKKI